MEELSINVDEFTDFLKESAKRYIRIKAKAREQEPDRPEFTPEEMDRLLFEVKHIPQVTKRIADFVYFITDGEYVKIGKGLPFNRMKSCQTGNPRRLKILFTIPVGEEAKGGEYWWRATPGKPAEEALHQMFKHYHILGEWFDILDRVDWNRCREYFGTICRMTEPDVRKYKAIIERRKTNERDPLEETD